MDSWFLPADGLRWTVDAVLAIVAIEGLLLIAWLRRRGRPVLAIGCGLLAGASLAAALRTSLSGASAWVTLACLAAAGLAHGIELLAHLRSDAGPRPRRASGD